MHVDAAVADGRRAEAVALQLRLGEHLGALVVGVDDEERAVVHRDPEPAVAVGGRGVDLVGGELLLPQDLAGAGVDAGQLAGRDRRVDAVAHQHR